MSGRIDPRQIGTRSEFGLHLTALRERAGLSVRALSRDAGVALGTVGGYLSGKHMPQAGSRDALVRLLTACGVRSEEDLLAWVEAAGRARRSARE